METGNAGPALEVRPTRPFFIPLVLIGGAGALLVAWLIMGAVGIPVEELGAFATLMVLSAAFSLALAAYWGWGAQRARLTISRDHLTVLPAAGRRQSVSLARLADVDLRLVDRGKVQLLVLTDAGKQSAEIAIGGWNREAEIISRIADAARQSGADVTPSARDVIRAGSPPSSAD